MFAVFSRCASSIEEGRRLENLSWRLWNRETFCCEPDHAHATTPAITVTPRDGARRRHDSQDIPELSASVESAVSDEDVEEITHRSTSQLTPLNIKQPSIRKPDSVES